MTNKTDGDILKNAPDGATHYSWETYCKANKDFFYDWNGEEWCAYFVPDGDMRSLADIEALVAKDKKIEELVRFISENTPLLSYLAIETVSSRVDGDPLFRFKDWIAKRDLEQQLRGLEEFIVDTQCSLDWDWDNISANELFNMMHVEIRNIREQAKGGDV